VIDWITSSDIHKSPHSFVSPDRGGDRDMICEQAEFVCFTKQVTFGLNFRQMMFDSRPVHAGFVGLSRQIPRVDIILDCETDRARRFASNRFRKDVRQLTKAELIVAGGRELKTIK
jgi:hypothetical protein